MELRQLRAFVRVVELGSISRAALDLNLVQSALSQQMTKLESELSTRLLQRSPQGVTPTEAGVAFFREAQLTAGLAHPNIPPIFDIGFLHDKAFFARHDAR